MTIRRVARSWNHGINGAITGPFRGLVFEVLTGIPIRPGGPVTEWDRQLWACRHQHATSSEAIDCAKKWENS